MELARVFAESGLEFDATLVFICWAGEEQGLIGSAVHAMDLKTNGVAVEAVFNNDIVGNSRGGNGIVDAETVRVYAIGPEDSPARALARYIQQVGGALRAVASHPPDGAGGSVRPRQRPVVVHAEWFPGHRLPRGQRELRAAARRQRPDRRRRLRLPGAERARQCRRRGLAGARAAGAEGHQRARRATCSSRDPSGYDASLRWNAAPGAVAYRIYWRDTWTNDWQHSQTIGNVTQFGLKNVSIDDFAFGVSAIGADGQESLVSSYVSPVRQSTPLKK